MNIPDNISLINPQKNELCTLNELFNYGKITDRIKILKRRIKLYDRYID